MDFDKLYGPCLPPALAVSEIEQKLMIGGLDLLNENTAVGLREYLNSASSIRLTRVIHMTTPILWLVDIEGNIRFGLEEVRNKENGKLHFVLPKNGPKVRDDEDRLGHPGLLSPGAPTTKLARIGGEIIYDPEFGETKWVITNNSGRYGKRPHLDESHLKNVQKRFAAHAIPLERFFMYSQKDVGEQK